MNRCGGIGVSRVHESSGFLSLSSTVSTTPCYIPLDDTFTDLFTTTTDSIFTPGELHFARQTMCTDAACATCIRNSITCCPPRSTEISLEINDRGSSGIVRGSSLVSTCERFFGYPVARFYFVNGIRVAHRPPISRTNVHVSSPGQVTGTPPFPSRGNYADQLATEQSRAEPRVSRRARFTVLVPPEKRIAIRGERQTTRCTKWLRAVCATSLSAPHDQK